MLTTDNLTNLYRLAAKNERRLPDSPAMLRKQRELADRIWVRLANAWDREAGHRLSPSELMDRVDAAGLRN